MGGNTDFVVVIRGIWLDVLPKPGGAPAVREAVSARPGVTVNPQLNRGGHRPRRDFNERMDAPPNTGGDRICNVWLVTSQHASLTKILQILQAYSPPSGRSFTYCSRLYMTNQYTTPPNNWKVDRRPRIGLTQPVTSLTYISQNSDLTMVKGTECHAVESNVTYKIHIQ
ncbi:hypothetical protein SK128_004737 [Halocaridina rubra]|uniref:Uncharacterized protein n=1 Tax=Halocaridina rubra TaxID=373956 RepID=A0AAN8WV71_HALRR